MKKAMLLLLAVASFVVGAAGAAEPKPDVFKGKLFPPNVILEHQLELGLSKQQFTEIRKTVVELQGNVAEHEWDVREAYQNIMAELDRSPIDQDKVLEHVGAALRAENEVKKLQVAMLVKLRNLLTEEQVAYLEATRQ
jgi:hypothetical protein